MNTFDHETFLSPFTWRYGSEAMRAIWSEAHKRRLMRRVWLALAEAQMEVGLVTADQLADLERSQEDIDIPRAEEIEKTTRHDVMAEILTWAEQAPVGGGIIHLGATSADITDNVDALRLRDSLALIQAGLDKVIAEMADRVAENADVVTLGWTHLQPAAPTTVGYRLAGTLQDLLADREELVSLRAKLFGKGFKGATGTAASYHALLEAQDEDWSDVEASALRKLDLRAAAVTTQVYPRKQDWRVLSLLSGIAASTSMFAFNLRLMQSPPYGEWSEGFGEGQVGSSAMPWKRNPINAENLNSMARYVAAMPQVAWENATQSLLERTLDDSANRRMALPSAFLAADEILRRALKLCQRLTVESSAVEATLARFGPFAATERVLMAAAGAGADRQVIHERIRQHSIEAWSALEAGGENSLAERLAADEEVLRWLDAETVRALVSAPEAHVGSAPRRAREMAETARAVLAGTDTSLHA